MTVTAAQILKIRRMVAEPTTTIYSDVLVQGFIEAHALMDERGREAYYWKILGATPVKTANVDWIETYDLNAAAADIWDEKMAATAALYDFQADGGDYTMSQAYIQARGMALFYRARAAVKLVKLRPAPLANGSGSEQYWIGNLPEDDD